MFILCFFYKRSGVDQSGFMVERAFQWRSPSMAKDRDAIRQVL